MSVYTSCGTTMHQYRMTTSTAMRIQRKLIKFCTVYPSFELCMDAIAIGRLCGDVFPAASCCLVDWQPSQLHLLLCDKKDVQSDENEDEQP